MVKVCGAYLVLVCDFSSFVFLKFQLTMIQTNYLFFAAFYSPIYNVPVLVI